MTAVESVLCMSQWVKIPDDDWRTIYKLQFTSLPGPGVGMHQ